jgi:Ran GTPase-activating protein (RanGAP) involved in mRNA processing and transport
VLQKIYFHAHSGRWLPRSLYGLEVLLRSKDSKVKELILEQVDTNTVGLHSVMQELRHNTTVTNLAIRNSTLSFDSMRQLEAVLCQNTALHTLDLSESALGSLGLADITSGLSHNTSIKSLDLSGTGIGDVESTNMLGELLRHNNTITSLCIGDNAFVSDAAAAQSIFEGLRFNTALQQLDLGGCNLGDQGISILANALAARNASTLGLDLRCNGITSVGVRALVDDNVEAVKTLTKLSLCHNPVGSKGVTVLADALGRNTMPNLKQLHLNCCGIDDDGFVALVSALQQSTSLQTLSLVGNDEFGERGFMALAESLPRIKVLQEINFDVNVTFQSMMPFLLEGFRKNNSLVKVGIKIAGRAHGEWSQELKCLGQRNRFTPLLKASDPPDVSPQLGIWSRALAKVALEPGVLFHILRNKPKLVGSTAGGSKKRNRNDE